MTDVRIINIFLNIFLVRNNCGVTRHRVPFVLMRLQRWVWLSNNNYSFNNIFLHPPGSVSLGKTLGIFLTIDPSDDNARVISPLTQCPQIMPITRVSHHFCVTQPLTTSVPSWMKRSKREPVCGLRLFILNVMIVNRTCCENLWIESSLLTVLWRAGIMQEKEWHVALNRNHYMKF